MEDIKNKFEKLKAAEQIRLLKLWDDAYYNQDNPLVTDEEYDYCVAYYNAKHPDKKYTSSLGNSSNDFKKFTHQYPVLSLAKITTKEGYDEYGKKFDYNVVVEPKIDGLTVVYYPDGTLVSRGNGHVGEILPNAKFIMGLPKPLDKPVRMEVCIDKDVYVTTYESVKFIYTEKDARSVEKVFDLLDNMPTQMKENLKEIKMVPSKTRGNVAGVTKYDSITFYGLSSYRNETFENIVYHEVAHTWAYELIRNKVLDFNYSEYSDLAREDDNYVSTYSRKAIIKNDDYSEDFAESVAFYMIDSEDFEMNHPARAEFISSIID